MKHTTMGNLFRKHTFIKPALAGMAILTAQAVCPWTVSVMAESRTDSLRFTFRQGRHKIDPKFGNNARTLRRLDRIISDSASSIKGIDIVGTASPEGSVDLNDRLSERRAQQLRKYIRGLGTIPDSIISVSFTGRDWTGLRDSVELDAKVPYQQQVEILLEEITSEDGRPGKEKESAGNLRRLVTLQDGKPYRYLYRNVFPSLRTTEVLIDWMPEQAPLLPLPLLTAGNTPGALATVPPTAHPALPPTSLYSAKEVKEKRNFYMSVKTNMLYDALLLPTIGAEFYLGRNFSVAGEWTYGWWDKNSRHRYWRAYGGDVAARWWFGKAAHEKPLTGHHIGVYAGLTTFDFEFGGKGRMGGVPGGTLWDRSMKSAGVEYGYSLPVAKRLNIDFTLGIGYFGGKVVKYIPDGESYLWQSTDNLRWFGPTKAEISLVWLIGHGNVNMSKKKKGGEL